MKIKNISILLAVIAGLFLFQLPVEAKTSKKSSSSKTVGAPQISIMDFCKPATKYEGPTGKTAKEIIAYLEKAGFKKENSFKSTYLVDDGIDEWNVPCITSSYEKRDIIININFKCDGNKISMNEVPYEIYIGEPVSEMKKFVADAKTKGFRSDRDSGIIYYHKTVPSGVSFRAVFGDDAELSIIFTDSH